MKYKLNYKTHIADRVFSYLFSVGLLLFGLIVSITLLSVQKEYFSSSVYFLFFVLLVKVLHALSVQAITFNPAHKTVSFNRTIGSVTISKSNIKSWKITKCERWLVGYRSPYPLYSLRCKLVDNKVFTYPLDTIPNIDTVIKLFKKYFGEEKYQGLSNKVTFKERMWQVLI